MLRATALTHHRSPPAELHGVSLAIEAGRFTLLTGAAHSGAGILLRILGLLDRPDSGEVWIDAQPAGCLDDAARLELRNRRFGYLFAEPFLLDSFTVAENVAMPLFKISGFEISQAQARTAQVLDFTGMSKAADLGVVDLSPLEHHKVSLARAIATAPRILIIEDAGLQLPPEDIREFASLLRAVPEVLNIAVLATSPAPAALFNPDRAIHLERGCIAADSRPVPIEEAPARE